MICFISVSNLLLIFVLPSVFFRVRPWLVLCLCLFLIPWLMLLLSRPSVAITFEIFKNFVIIYEIEQRLFMKHEV
jgi:hypothetical protein